MKERDKINKVRSAMRFGLLGLALAMFMVIIQYPQESSYLVFAEAENLQPSPGQAFVSPLMPVNDGLDQVIESEVVDVGKPPEGVVLLDLTIDQDKDGLPDQLVVELRQRLTQGQPTSTSLAPAPAGGKADDLNWRLPYAPRTRQLQAQAAKVIQYSTKVKNAEEYEKIAKRLHSLEEQMMQDPNYALVMKTFQTLLDQEIQKRLNPAARADSQTAAESTVAAVAPRQDVGTKLYLPAIFGFPRIDYTNLKRGDIPLSY